MNPIKPLSELTEFEVGYICGLLVGEGSFTGDKKAPCIAMKLHVDDLEPLKFLLLCLGGNLYGPYHHQGRTYRLWRLTGKPLKAVLPLLESKMPQSKKRNQMLQWLLKWT